MTRRPVLQIAELKGRLVRLRPFRSDEVRDAWVGLARQDEVAHPRPRLEDRRLEPSQSFTRRMAVSGRLWRGCLDTAIDVDGRLVGHIQARTNPKQTLPAGVFELGIILYSPDDRGKGYGSDATVTLTDWLFSVAGAARVQATTDKDNAPMRAVFDRIGFRLEGIMRACGLRADGSRVDGALYAVIREDWPVEPLGSPDRHDQLAQ